MNPLLSASLEDVQSQTDSRGVAIDEVGISDLRYPVRVAGRDGGLQPTVATLAATVDLPAEVKGTHMSRFIEALGEHMAVVDPSSCAAFVEDLCGRLDSSRARVELRFPYFLERAAPVTGLPALVDVEATVVAEAGVTTALWVGVRVPVTSLCPCSREISDYGAHNQRGYVEIEVTSHPGAEIWFEDIIEVANAAGSAPIYSLLKRADERFVTMAAYENPAFVEDIARNVVVALRTDARVAEFVVRVINQESIHNHNAIATVRGRRAARLDPC
jgi:GTP cyclohydrolase I